jgi:hypothetical protein
MYGRLGMTVEQINDTTGTVTYLHHDQAGSTRLITGSTGTVTGKCSYGPYGIQTREGTDTTPGSSTCVRESTTRRRVRHGRSAGGDHWLANDYANDNPFNRYDPSGL